MNRIPRAAIIVSLIEALKAKDSWCGETNVQKACFFLQELADVPLALEFVLYKYGPYSFELTDELTSMRADGFLALRVRDPRYGPCYVPGELAGPLRERYPKTIARYANEVECVAQWLGDKGVADLERVATALYIRKKASDTDEDERARRIHDLKPHISISDARAAIREVEEMFAEVEHSMCQ
ncbi:MAG: hypothetical protein WCY59_07585 [Anaerovoracaceae bacterium]|nr:hypothetical protein [Pirellulaceae bacterium]